MDYEKKGEGEVSEWNEALFKMKRLHELQTEINRVKMNLLSKHIITGQWNYEVWFNSVVALFSEGEPKYSETEKDEIRKLKAVVERLFDVCPVHKMQNHVSYGGYAQKKPMLIKENWQTIKQMIEILESKVKFYNDKHGLSTRNVENQDGRSILR